MTKNGPPAASYGSTTGTPPLSDGAVAAPSPHPSHLSTYTAGEDAGRLATLAKEFGLSRTREPKVQVRERVSDPLAALNLERLKLWTERIISLDESYLEMRYRSLYSAHLHEDDTSSSDESDGGEAGLLLGRLPSVGEDDGGEEEEQRQRPRQTKPYQTQLSEDQSADPHAAGLGGSLPSAALGIVKGMVGPAILYLPHGFASAGYLVAVPVLALSTAMFLWSSECLLESWKRESEKVNAQRLSANNEGHGLRLRKRVRLSYPELAYRAFGAAGERLVQVGISLMQSGVCLTYLIFVPQNLRVVALLLFDWDVSTTWTLALMVAVQVPLSWIRDIRRLTVTNLLANGLILYGLITCLGFAADDIHSGGRDGLDDGAKPADFFLAETVRRVRSLPAFNPSGWFLFLGTSVLLFEGSITLLVPLQEAVHAPADRERFPSLYRRVILGIVAFYAFFGVACWAAFGNDVHTVMTTSLPPGTRATTVQLAYSLAVVFTFPLQNFPSLEIVCVAVEKVLSINDEGIVDRGKGSGGGGARRNVISALLVILLSIVAVSTMDDLDKVVSLMGSLLGCPLAFVLPPLIQNRLDKGRRLGEGKRTANNAVALLGVGAMAVSSVATILKWD